MIIKKERNYNLDIVRIIAIIFVVLVHVDNYYGSWQNFAEWGANGVSLFFILSGYLGAISYNNKLIPVSYYRKRLLRIIPTYYIALLINYVFDVGCDLIFNGSSLQKTFGYYGIGGIRYLRYFVFANTIIPSEQPQWWNNRYALWTMPAFALFYLMVPLIYRFIRRTEIGLVISLGLLAIVSYASNWVATWPVDNIDTVAFQNPFFQVPTFLLGHVIYLAIKEKKQMLVATVMVIIAFVTGMKWNTYELLFVLFIMIAAELPNIITGSRMKKYIGNLSDSSYTIYLIHLVLVSAYNILASKLLGNDLTYFKFALVFTVTIGTSYLFWKILIAPLDCRINMKYIKK